MQDVDLQAFRRNHVLRLCASTQLAYTIRDQVADRVWDVTGRAGVDSVHRNLRATLDNA